MEKHKQPQNVLSAVWPGLLTGTATALGLLLLGAALISKGILGEEVMQAWVVAAILAGAFFGALISGTVKGTRRAIPIVWVMYWGVLVVLSVSVSKDGEVGMMAVKTGAAAAAGSLCALAYCIKRGSKRSAAGRRAYTKRNRKRGLHNI